ncbi:MAG: AmmeMemoRadiSam system radical SAM enzyme [Lachnospiraceae bacterium]|nr:AmmeMemoRadiSam system radical SAM enzyme [Lachnospiraceae bacterium]
MRCKVCMHHCELAPGQTGRCRARKNTDGEIRPVNYGRVTSVALDPIEKKPLADFHPGSLILSVGSFGCNLSCPFCQNHSISQAGEDIYTEELMPEELCALALKCRDERGNIGVAYTYNEALVGYEYVRDSAKLVHEAGLLNVIVTNGEAEEAVLDELLPYTDAMNIDLKAFTDEAYRKLGGDLETVKAFIRKAAGSCHVELTTLVVPGLNDSAAEMEEEAAWIASVDPGIVLHLSRYFPRYRHTEGGPTTVETIYALKAVAEKHMYTVLTGNL